MANRRDFLTSAAASWLAIRGVPRPPSARAANRLQWHSISDGAWMVEHGGGNVTVLAGRAGAVIVDTKMPSVGTVLAEAIEAKVGRVETVVLTHHHGDHAGGVHGFPGRAVVAQANATERIRVDSVDTIGRAKREPQALAQGLVRALTTDFGYQPAPALDRAAADFVGWLADARVEALLPTHPVATAETVGQARAIEVVHVGPGHTDNDVFVHDRQRDLIAVGDLLFDRHHPFIDDDAGATTLGWQRTLAAILERAGPATKIVSGHGRVVDRAGLAAQATYFERVRALVDQARREGRDRAAVVALPNTAFPGFGFADLWPDVLGVLFDELAGQRS